MTTSGIEILAEILILISVVKLLIIVVNVRAWLGFAKWIYAKPAVTSIVALTLACLVLYILLSSGLTIVHILAVCLFIALVIMIGVAPYAGRLLEWFETQNLNTVLKEQWLYIVIWLLLLGWGLGEILTTLWTGIGS